VKPLIAFLLFAPAVLAQSPDTPRIVTFNPADKEHCKVVVVSGKPLLETTYNGTLVAINMPQNWGNGEFSVYIAVAQVDAGEAEVNPKAVSALYPDAAHTRFAWFDKGRDLDTQLSMRAEGMGPIAGQPGSPGSHSIADSSTTAPPPNHPEAMGSIDPHAGTRSEEELRQMQMRNEPGNAAVPTPLDPTHPPVFLKLTTVKQGSKATGYVFLRRPKGSKIEVTPTAMLDEIDIPINGVIFRF
jgi:hypothetical protein